MNYSEIRKSFIKKNKTSREKAAIKLGYKSAKEYIEYLDKMINNSNKVADSNTKKQTSSKKTSTKTTDKKPTIHIVDILDCSGSMFGTKITNANKGINEGIENLKKDNSINYLYTICDFSDSTDIRFEFINKPINEVETIKYFSRGMTALYDAIGLTINKIKEFKADEDKVLINIYTDGGENNSKRYSKYDIKELIQNCEKESYTVTFIGTDRDVKDIIRELNIKESNTLSYDGSGEGLKKSLEATQVARAVYSKAILDGEDVKENFYKKVMK